MSVILVVSVQSGDGRSMIAAALAYRMARDGRSVTLARLAGDEGAERDARTFASIEYLGAPDGPVAPDGIASLASVGDVVLEAPPGPPDAGIIERHGARVMTVARATSPEVTVPATSAMGTIVTNVPPADVDIVRRRRGVLAVLAEDRVLAAPSVADIAGALGGRWLVQSPAPNSIARVMIGTISSDAASPYFGVRERKCVVTRYDKTDVQLAALFTDMALLVLTGGGQPSPYLLDRIASTRDDISVLLVDQDTVDAMRAIEGLYGRGRFDGMAKLERAVELLDAAGVTLEATA